MTIDRYADDRIRSWLVTIAPDRLPDHVLPSTFERTRHLPQMSRRRRWASVSMRAVQIPVAIGAFAVVVVVVSSVLGNLGGTGGPGDANGPLGVTGGPGDANGPLGVQFGTTAQISGQWTSSSDAAFSVQFESPEDEHLYWRAAVYDQFDQTAWSQSVTAGVDVPPGDDVLGNTADAVTAAGRRPVTFTVVPDEFRASTVLSPEGLSQVDTTVRVSYVDEARFVANVDRNGADPYTVTALVRERGDEPPGITENKLRAAGTAYPPAITQRYLQVPAGAIPPGGAAEQLLEDILANVPDPDNPYDVASTMVDYLQSSGNFTYDTDIRDLPCERLSTVECFAQFRRGYCQQYATTMAILLRELGIPTRLVAGFLPGLRGDAGVSERVRFSEAHAWVEVYFPGYGWVEFDPTGGGIASTEPLPTGDPAP